MKCNTALLKGDVTLRRERMARGTESRETQCVLVHAGGRRKEARVIAAALEDAAHAGASGGGYGYSRDGGVRAEELV
jgi:hypothetical protein